MKDKRKIKKTMKETNERKLKKSKQEGSLEWNIEIKMKDESKRDVRIY